jgi:hypothetical protein
MLDWICCECGASEDELQAFETFTSQLVEYAHTASVVHDGMLCTLLLQAQSALEHGVESGACHPSHIYAKREPALRKKEGRPTNKRVARLKEKKVEEDVRPYVEKAKALVSADSFCFLFMVAPDLHLCVTDSHSCSCNGVG